MPKKRIRNFQGRNFKKIRENDKLTLRLRSLLMSKIHSRGTKLELFLITLLKRSVKNKFITNVKELQGKPDVVFPKEKLCVFVDSDFWHGWQYPRWKHLLKNDSWREKINNNRKRDIKTSHLLKRKGWKVIRIWEHQLKNERGILTKIQHSLKSK